MNKNINKYLKELTEFIPKFSDYWISDESLFNSGDNSTVHGVFCEFSSLVIVRLENESLECPEKLFLYIESVIATGGEPANATCTCFLENIFNRIPSSINPEKVLPYLGHYSAEYYQAWNDFNYVENHRH